MFISYYGNIVHTQPESCALELGATSKTVGSSMAQLLTAANQGNESYTGIAARDTASALKLVVIVVVMVTMLYITEC